MKLWISRNSEVPIQEQLTTQLILGIVSADLVPQERLPSSTQLARQFHIHANTVRAAYRELVERGWAEWRAGSGFYVRELESHPKLDPNLDLDHLISTFLDIARGRGHSLGEIQARIQRWLARQVPDHIVVIEPDNDLREIMIAEIHAWSRIPVVGLTFDDARKPDRLLGGFCVALYDHAEDVGAALPAGTPCLLLRSRSIPGSLAGESRPARDTVITVISGWPQFLKWARTTLIAIGLEDAALDLRDARKSGWDRGLTGKCFIIADCLAAHYLPAGCTPRIFKVIADESMAELRKQIALLPKQGSHPKDSG